jgi:hypothetical protein
VRALPPPGDFACTVSVKIAIGGTAQATIYYTTDHTNPSTASQVYTTPIPISQAGSTEIRAMAAFDGPCPLSSDVVSGMYAINSAPGPATPVVTPAAGTFHKAFTATLTGSGGVAAMFCYTLDGSSATCSAACGVTSLGPGLYVSKGNATPVMSVTKAPGAAAITVRAVGCAAGYAPSDAPYASATWH